jgi:hypothetical protein
MKQGGAVGLRFDRAGAPAGPPPVSSRRCYRVDQPVSNGVHRGPTGNLSFDKARQIPRHGDRTWTVTYPSSFRAPRNVSTTSRSRLEASTVA